MLLASLRGLLLLLAHGRRRLAIGALGSGVAGEQCQAKRGKEAGHGDQVCTSFR
jgi:hypothetical protein